MALLSGACEIPRVASRVRGSGTYDVPPRDFQLRNASPHRDGKFV